MNKSQQIIFSIGIALFLVVGATIRSGASTIAFFLFLLSCFWLYQSRNIKIIKLNGFEKLWLWSVVLLNVAVLVSSYEYFSVDFSEIDSLTRFLFAIPVYFLVRKIGINLDIFLMGGAIGAIAMGGYAYYQLEILGLGQSVGMTDHNYFGQLSLLLTFISFCAFTYYNKSLKWFFLCASLIGLYAILTSGSRGVWIAMPAIALLMLKYDIIKVNFVKKVISLIIFASLMGGVYLNNAFNVKDRADAIINQTADYFVKDEVKGSAGLRLEMWRASLLMIKDNYGLGSGAKGYNKGVYKLLKNNEVHPSLKRFTVEPHNYYLKILISQGVFGIVFLFLMLFIPMKIFLINIKKTSKDIRLNAMLGIGVIVAYLDFMLSNTTLDVQLMSVFLAFILFPLLGNLHFQTNSLGKYA